MPSLEPSILWFKLLQVILKSTHSVNIHTREQVCSGLELKFYTTALCHSTIDDYGWLKWQLSLTGRSTWGTQDSLVLSKKILKYAIRKSLLKYFNLFLLGKGRKREKNNSADKKVDSKYRKLQENKSWLWKEWALRHHYYSLSWFW